MILRSPQPQPANTPPAPEPVPALPAEPPRSPWITLLAGLSGFLTFMPYAAFPIGTTTAIQFATCVQLLICAQFILTVRRVGVQWTSLLLLGPLILATLKVGFGSDGDMLLAAKTLPIWSLSLMAMASTQFAGPQYFLEILTGTALAALVHFAVGAWQMYAFTHGGDLPLLWLYVNQSFLSVQDNARDIAKYVQRPFGLFPEPSAMSSSLAPVVLLWMAELFGIIRLRREPKRWQRVLFGAAVVGSLALMIVSRSGHAAVVMVAAAALVGLWLSRARATPTNVVATLFLFGVALPVTAYFAAEALGDRLGGNSSMGNSSWEDRSNSLIIGLKLFTDGDLPTLIFGFGPGHMAAMLERVARLEAVWSVTLTYVYETGIIGAVAVLWIGVYLLRIFKAERFNVTYIVIVAVWFVGITITTSYVGLLTVWMTLGWLTLWPTLCETAPREPETLPLAALAGESGLSRRQNQAKWVPMGWRTVTAPSDQTPPKRRQSSKFSPSSRWSER